MAPACHVVVSMMIALKIILVSMALVLSPVKPMIIANKIKSVVKVVVSNLAPKPQPPLMADSPTKHPLKIVLIPLMSALLVLATSLVKPLSTAKQAMAASNHVADVLTKFACLPVVKISIALMPSIVNVDCVLLPAKMINNVLKEILVSMANVHMLALKMLIVPNHKSAKIKSASNPHPSQNQKIKFPISLAVALAPKILLSTQLSLHS